MSKIAFIAPDKDLFLRGQAIIRELKIEHEVDAYLARLKRAIRLAKQLEHKDADVIVCRGGTAQVIVDAGINIPLVEIRITGQDLAQAFQDVKKTTGLPNPKIAMIAFQNMIYDVEVFQDILGIRLEIYPLKTSDDIPLRVEEAARSDADVIIGGIKTLILAQKRGLKTHPITSSNFSIRAAFLEAKKILLARSIEKKRAQEFKTLIDYSQEGIISIDQNMVINVFNREAERLLNLSAKEILGQKIASVLPGIDVTRTLSEGQEFIGQAVHLSNSWLSVNIAPIEVNNEKTGAIITLQDITRIQEMEASIRKEVITRRFVAKYRMPNILGTSKEIQEVKRIAREISFADATVLISGETGTGKELFAQSIHSESRRKNGPFVAVNCAALPPSLLESELFGYVEGAFTGATKKGKPGLFELAHNGTIFLDEISEMDKYGQSRLLRVLQERQIMRLGDDRYIPIDVRIIAATNRSLISLVEEGLFRRDLYYRLKVLTLNIPPLRARTGDVEYLARHFLAVFNKQYGRQVTLTPQAIEVLSRHPWPGNVRELMHFIERIVIIAKEKSIDEETIQKYFAEREYEVGSPLTLTDDMANLPEDKRISAALAKTNANIKKAAQLLNVDRSTLYRKLKEYKIQVKKTY